MACAAETQCRVDFTLRPSGRVTAARGRVVSAVDFDDFAGCSSFTTLVALDEVAVAQAHFAARRQAEDILRRHLLKVVLLDVEHSARRALCAYPRGVFGIVDGLQLLDLTRRDSCR